MSHTHINTKNNWKYITRVHMCVQLSCVYVCICVYSYCVYTCAYVYIHDQLRCPILPVFFKYIYIYRKTDRDKARKRERPGNFVQIRITSYKYVLGHVCICAPEEKREKEKGKRGKKGGKRNLVTTYWVISLSASLSFAMRAWGGKRRGKTVTKVSTYPYLPRFYSPRSPWWKKKTGKKPLSQLTQTLHILIQNVLKYPKKRLKILEKAKSC